MKKRLFFATRYNELSEILEVVSCDCVSDFESCPVVGYNESTNSFESVQDASNYSVFLVNDNKDIYDNPLADFEIVKASDYLIYHENTRNDNINSKFKWKRDSHHTIEDASLYYRLIRLIKANPEISSSEIIESIWPSSMADKESIIDFVMKLLGSNNKPELPEILKDIQGKYDSVSDADVAKLSENLRIFVNECLERLKP